LLVWPDETVSVWPLITISKPAVAALCAGSFCGLKLSTAGPTFDVLPFGSHSQK